MQRAERLFQIDLLRFIAALGVVLFHYTFSGHAADDMSVLEFPFLSSVFKYGYLGVELFFMISGFVIIMSVENATVFTFIKSRIMRLYPAYWFCVTVTFVLIMLFGAPYLSANTKQYLVNLTMFHRFAGVENIDPAYWTLLVEIKFYFLIGIFLVVNRFKKIDVDVLIYFWLILSYLSFVADFQNTKLLKSVFSVFSIYYSSFFIAGMLCYKIYKKGATKKYLISLACCVPLSLYFMDLYVIQKSAEYNCHFSIGIVSVVILLFYVLLLLISTNKLDMFKLPKFAKIGALTYPLYLIHQNVGFIIFNNFGNNANKYIILGATIIIMLLFAFTIHRYIEKPLSYFLKKKLDKAAIFKGN